MKIRVKRAFLDKENKLIQRNVNDVFEASEDRAKELSEKGFVSILSESSETARKAPQSDKAGETAKERRREEALKTAYKSRRSGAAGLRTVFQTSRA